ncbi:MAG TPA: hypothetical protein VGC76_17050 [Pyrinomonadaceae bacterium]|jgi:hypothetical protein
MVFINIPYVPENNRLDKTITKKELEALDISDSAKLSAYAAIYNLNPRGVNFDSKDLPAARTLENALQRLGIPYRQSEESEY